MKETITTGIISIQSPELLHIQKNEAFSYGAHQAWYLKWKMRKAGCGPTAASNLLWYLAATRPEQAGALYHGNGSQRTEMLALMEDVCKHIKPGLLGVNKASMFTKGAVRFGEAHGVSLSPRVLEVPAEEQARPDSNEVLMFLTSALGDDLPIAFLNLSNGGVKNLEAWHWVTLVAVDCNLQAEIYDQGRRQNIDINLWLNTTNRGGAFVALEAG